LLKSLINEPVIKAVSDACQYNINITAYLPLGMWKQKPLPTEA